MNVARFPEQAWYCGLIYFLKYFINYFVIKCCVDYISFLNSTFFVNIIFLNIHNYIINFIYFLVIYEMIYYTNLLLYNSCYNSPNNAEI